jgi:LysM repeat protein
MYDVREILFYQINGRLYKEINCGTLRHSALICVARVRDTYRGCNSVVEWQLPKLYMAVRFRSPALISIMKNIILIFLVLLTGGCATSSHYTGPILPASTQGVPGIQHRVLAGQTLWRISKIYNVDIDDILRLNRLSADATIEIGQLLLIPNSSVSQNEPIKFSGDDFAWPLKGRVIAGFGSNYGNLMNKGINIQAQTGANILAARSGRVVFYAANLGNFGKTIIIDHGDGLRSIYSQASEIMVHSGENVARGALIGRVGSSIRNKNSYLHFEIRRGSLAQNPLFYLP